MRDGFNRTIDYLRLSVTDRCNLRCVYCLPEALPRFAPSQDQLTDTEIVELIACFAAAGVSKLRITGGEPLVRPGLPGLISSLARTPGIDDISLSTNGVLLAPLMSELKAAGLKRVNVSLDSLKPEQFSRIARFGKLDSVLDGIAAALAAGLEPVKINVVVARGMNEDEVADFAKWTDDEAVHVRFIELMPMGETGFFTSERRVPLNEMMQSCGPMEALARQDWPLGHGPARYFKRSGAHGTLGFISALSCGFCSSCNRVRLASQGKLLAWLEAEGGVDLRRPLRRGGGRGEIQALMR